MGTRSKFSGGLIFSVMVLANLLGASIEPTFASGSGTQISIDQAIVGEVATVDLSKFPTGSKFSIITWQVITPRGGGPVTYNYPANTSVPYLTNPPGKSYTPNLLVPVYCNDPVPASLRVEVSALVNGASEVVSASLPLQCKYWPDAAFLNPRAFVPNRNRAPGEYLAGDLLGGGWDAISNEPPLGTKYITKHCFNGGVCSEVSLWAYTNTPLIGSVFTVKFTREYFGYVTPNLSWEGSIVFGPKVLAPTPTFSGAPIAGSVLTAIPGVWEPGFSLAYNWVNAAGNPEGTGLTKNLQPSDVGRTLYLEITGTKVGYVAKKVRSAPITVGLGDQKPGPKPSISGAPKVGGILIANPGAWDAGVTLQFRWFIDGVQASGSGQGYEIRPDDFGRKIVVQVIGSKSGFNPVASSLSDPVSASLGSLSNTPIPTISGSSTALGTSITASIGTWDSGATLTYQWLRDGVAVEGATSTSYSISAPDTKHTLSIRVTGTKSGYAPISRTSNAVTVGISFLNRKPTPIVSGNGIPGGTLSSLQGEWDPGVALAFNWLRDGNLISGASSPQYTVVQADQGHNICLRVTGSKPGYNSEVALSNNLFIAPAVSSLPKPVPQISASPITPVSNVQPPAVQSIWSQPILSGASSAGQKLRVTLGTWSKGETFTYQWLKDGIPIRNADGQSYTVKNTDIGHKIYVKVTGKLTGYTDMIKSSPAVFIRK